MSNEARITALEAQLAVTQAELAELKAAQPPAKKPAPPRREDEGVRITTFLPMANPQHMPSEDEARALLRIVTARYPRLKFPNADDELESFRASFRFICSLTKTAAPVTKYAPSWWIDCAQQWARDAGVQGVIRSLLPAIVACGDVQYSFDDRSAFWLHPYRTSGRVVDAQAWRKVLDGSGDLIAPTKLDVFVDHSIGLQRVQATW
jgi:hypothetical protein